MKRKGSALIFITTLSSLLLLVAIAVCVNSVSDMNITTDEKTRTDLEFACQSALNRAKIKIEQSFNNQNLNILEPFVTFQGTIADDTGNTPASKAFNDETFNTGNTDFYSFTITPTTGKKPIYVKYCITEDLSTNNGWQKSSAASLSSNKMRVEAVASYYSPGTAYSAGDSWVGMEENIFARRSSLFKYQIFFQNDLEILPGIQFNLTGLIHTNSNMYLNGSLNVHTDSLTAAGTITRGRLDSSTIDGTVKISSGDESGSLVEMSKGNDASNTNWASLAKTNWQGSVLDGQLGATTQSAPSLDAFKSGGYYNQKAGINIDVKKTSGTTSYVISYNGTTKTFASTDSTIKSALAEKTIYDYRENKSVSVTNVDLNKLKTVLGYYPSNGVVYMTREDAVADNDSDEYTADSDRVVTGFKIINGSTLPAATTLVSNDPVYIQGDFNKHTSTNPSTDTWQPCAVIGDAVTLLSNSWSDSITTKLPTASNTEYNMLMISGNVPTKTGQYSGGLENFPRLLENWTNKTSTISGGFIQLFRSQYATGTWNYGNYYAAPTRNWGSESRFSDWSNFPPGFVDMFPSVAQEITYSGWKQISESESLLQ